MKKFTKKEYIDIVQLLLNASKYNTPLSQNILRYDKKIKILLFYSVICGFYKIDFYKNEEYEVFFGLPSQLVIVNNMLVKASWINNLSYHREDGMANYSSLHSDYFLNGVRYQKNIYMLLML